MISSAFLRWRTRCAPVARIASVAVACVVVLGAYAAASKLQAGEFLGCDCGDGVCDPCCGGGCGGCGTESVWIGAEYLLWQIDGTYLPALATSSPATTPLTRAGELGQPTTSILAGNRAVGDAWRDGFRVYGGMYLDDCHNCAIAGDYFNLGNDDYDYLSQPSPNTIVTRPFYNAQTNEQDAELVSVPNELDGTVSIHASDDFQGAGINLQHCMWRWATPADAVPARKLSPWVATATTTTIPSWRSPKI